MPGRNQLLRFIDDINPLGDELTVRRTRGDTIVEIQVPETISEKDDSDDFLYGMPEDSLDGVTSASDGDETSASFDALADDVPSSASAGDDFDVDAFLKENLGDVNAAPNNENADATMQDLGELPDTDDSVSLDDVSLNDDLPSDDTNIDADAPTLDNFDAQNDANADNSFDANLDSDFDLPDFDFSSDDASKNDGADAAPALDTILDAPSANDDSSANFDVGESLADFDDIDFSAQTDDATQSADTNAFDAGLGTGADTSFAADMPSFDADVGAGTSTSVDDLPSFDMNADANAFDAELDTNANVTDGANDSLPDFSDDLELPDFDIGTFDAPTSISLNDTNAQSQDTSTADAGFSMDSDFSMGDGADFASDELGDIGDIAGADSADANFALSDEENVDDDFSIPGFSDVTEIAPKQKKAPKTSVTSGDEEKPTNPNEFTDAEYKKFLENLSTYPLNLRSEVQNLLIENKFADNINAEIVRMVIKKVTARQLASRVGKLLDKMIDVPRNYEKRSAAEYEAYKHSAEYQIKNKIVPMAFFILVVGIFALSIGILFNTFIYKPVRAEILYKQGYTYLENDQFPESQEKFLEAANKFKAKKSWFFKYADGYRAKRQYGHARQMYKWILEKFPRDKNGGLQYASMELYDLQNYEEAERIVRRHVLDNFINDADGMLLLGDIYLEWATDKDASKFTDAFATYATVMELFGTNDTYLARMLRYYIRTDNLKEVLPLKSHFYPDKKSGPKRIKALGASDVVELSAYLLDKLYGTMTPQEEYLREYIEDVRALLERAIVADPNIPEAYYNYARYFIYTANSTLAQSQLEKALQVFDTTTVARTKPRILKNVDAYRLLGEMFVDQQEYLKAEELYTEGINLFESEKDISALNPTSDVGKLYADMADLDYFISGDNNHALRNYRHAVEYGHNTPSIQYRIGFVEYGNGEYVEAVSAFLKASEEKGNDLHLLLALGNALALRNDYFAAQGYYERFMNQFAYVKSQIGLLLPQIQATHQDLVQNYMYTANNYAVTLNKIAERTGESSLNAQAMLHFSESMRAWDSLTRNQTTMIRLDGGNLASQNMKYLSFSQSLFDPALYYDIPRTLEDEEVLMQANLKSSNASKTVPR